MKTKMRPPLKNAKPIKSSRQVKEKIALKNVRGNFVVEYIQDTEDGPEPLLDANGEIICKKFVWLFSAANKAKRLHIEGQRYRIRDGKTNQIIYDPKEQKRVYYKDAKGRVRWKIIESTPVRDSGKYKSGEVPCPKNIIDFQELISFLDQIQRGEEINLPKIENIKRTRLTQQNFVDIAKDKGKYSVRQLAAKHNCHYSTISRIHAGKLKWQEPKVLTLDMKEIFGVEN